MTEETNLDPSPTFSIEVTAQNFNNAWKELIESYGGIQLKILDRDKFINEVMEEMKAAQPGIPSHLDIFITSAMIRVIENKTESVKVPTFGKTFTEGWDF